MTVRHFLAPKAIRATPEIHVPTGFCSSSEAILSFERNSGWMVAEVYADGEEVEKETENTVQRLSAKLPGYELGLAAALERIQRIESALAVRQTLLAGSGSRDLQLAKQLGKAVSQRLKELRQNLEFKNTPQIELLLKAPIKILPDPYSVVLGSEQPPVFSFIEALSKLESVSVSLKFVDSKQALG